MKTRTPTETLMTAMEDFGTDEPKECIIICTTEGGDMTTYATTDSLSIRLGMLSTAVIHCEESIRSMKHES